WAARKAGTPVAESGIQPRNRARVGGTAGCRAIGGGTTVGPPGALSRGTSTRGRSGTGVGPWTPGVALPAHAAARSRPPSAARPAPRSARRRGIEGRQDEGTEVGTGVPGRDPEQEGEHGAGLLGRDDGVDLAPGGGVPRVQVALVIAPHLLDGHPGRRARLAMLLLRALELGAVDRHDRGL